MIPVQAMDFGALSPEVNSGRLYAGPGPAPLLAASAAWGRLAAELSSAAAGYQTVIAELTGQGWLGPAAEAMAAAAGPYLAWIGSTAAQAEQVASRMTLAAGAFEQAFAAVVPPPVIAANRARLASLLAANAFGQNAAAIADAEVEYGQMWVQDAMAMYGYATRSAAAVDVPAFSVPPPVADGSAPGSAHSQLSQLATAIPQTLHGLSSNSAAGATGSVQADAPSASQLASYIEMVAKSILPANDTNISTLYGMGQYARNLNTDLDVAAATGGRFGFGSGTFAPPPPAEPAAVRPMVSAALGDTAAVGRLTVPAAWTANTGEVRMTSAAVPTGLPGTLPGAAPAAGPAASGGAAGDLAAAGMAGLAGRAVAAGVSKRRPAGAAQRHLERLAAELTGTAEVQHWHTDISQRRSLLEELAQRPGVHEVYFDSDDPNPPEPGIQRG